MEYKSCPITVSAQIERHSWLECQEAHLGPTMANFGKKSSKNTVIFDQKLSKNTVFLEDFWSKMTIVYLMAF